MKRTKQEQIEYFQQLANEYETAAHREEDEATAAILASKADAYEIAAFEIDRNMDEGQEAIAAELLNLLEADRSDWKYGWIKDLCKLCVEYLTLDGLEDATRAAEIPDEILDIAEEALNS